MVHEPTAKIGLKMGHNCVDLGMKVGVNADGRGYIPANIDKESE
jgi:hypothetical protein